MEQAGLIDVLSSKVNYFKIALLCFFSMTFLSSVYMLSSISTDNLKYARKDATGFKSHQATQFFYFYKNLSLFPLAVEKKELRKLNNSPGDAIRFIKKYPDKLRMEIKHWYRFGESARIWALFPAYILGESMDNLTLKPLNTILFSISGLVLFFACYRWGGIITALAGLSLYLSSPFLLAECFLKDNIFAIQPMLHIFAISLFVIFHGRSVYALATITIVTTSLAGLFSEIRGENITVLLVPILYWFIVAKLPLKRKVLVVVAMLLLFSITKAGIREHFTSSYDRTYHVLESVGGVTFDGGKTGQHPIWHPLLAGLGDFGQDKGFLWSDKKIFYRVLGNAGYTPKEIRAVGESYYDPETKYYYKRPETLGNYASLARNEFVNTVAKDPIWYAGILAKRAARVLSDFPPMTMHVLKNKIEVAFYPLLVCLAIIGLFVHGKNYFRNFTRLDAFAVLAALSMSGIAFVIHTGNGATFGTVMPLVASIILISKCAPVRRDG